MLNLTDEQKALFKESGNFPGYIFTFSDINLTITNETIHDQAVTVKESIMDSSELTLGGCIASSIEFEVSEIMANDITGHEFTAKIEVTDAEGNVELESLPMGTYTPTTVQQVDDRDYKKVTAYDRLTRATADVSDWYNTWFGDGDTHTVKETRESLLSYLGIPYVVQNLTNDTYVCEKTVESAQMIGLDILKMLCTINGGFGRMNRSGQFEVITLAEITGSEPDTSEDYRTVKYEEYTSEAVTGIIVKGTTDDVGIDVGDKDTNPYVITGNIFLYNNTKDNQKIAIRTVATNILNLIKNIEYRPHTSNIDGLPYMECGDVFKIVKENDTLESYIFSRTLSGVAYLQDQYEAKGTQERKNEVSATSEMYRTSGKQFEFVTSVDGLRADLTNFETNTETKFELVDGQISSKVSTEDMESSITQSADEIKSTVSTAEGKYKESGDGTLKPNLTYSTVFPFGDDSDEQPGKMMYLQTSGRVFAARCNVNSPGITYIKYNTQNDVWVKTKWSNAPGLMDIMNDIASNGTIYVVAGESETGLLYSYNPGTISSWTEATVDEDSWTYNPIKLLNYGTESHLFFGFDSKGYAVYSEDGVNWNILYRVSGITTRALEMKVCYLKENEEKTIEEWFILYADGKYRVSNNLRSNIWSTISAFSGYLLTDIACNNGTISDRTAVLVISATTTASAETFAKGAFFVSKGIALTTDPGEIGFWTIEKADGEDLPQIFSLTWIPSKDDSEKGVFFAVGYEGRTYYSEDGETWHKGEVMSEGKYNSEISTSATASSGVGFFTTYTGIHKVELEMESSGYNIELYGYGEPSEFYTKETNVGKYYLDNDNGKVYRLKSDLTWEYITQLEEKDGIYESQIQQLQNQIVLSVRADGKMVEVELKADPEEGSEFNVTADNIRMTAEETISFISGGNLDLTGKNITIASDNFTVDSEGNVEANAMKITGGTVEINSENKNESVITLSGVSGLNEAYVYTGGETHFSYAGDGQPDDSFGEEGEFYLDISNGGKVYWRTQSGWVEFSYSQDIHNLSSVYIGDVSLQTGDGLLLQGYNYILAGSEWARKENTAKYGLDGITLSIASVGGGTSGNIITKYVNIKAVVDRWTGSMYTDFDPGLEIDAVVRVQKLNITNYSDGTELTCQNGLLKAKNGVAGPFYSDETGGHKLVTGTIVYTYGDGGKDPMLTYPYEYIDAPGINGTMPATVCNGDYDASDVEVAAVQVVPSTQQIRFKFLTSPPSGSVRFSYSYWT